MSDMIVSESGVFAKAELDIQVSTAKAYPRNVKTFVENCIEMATFDQDTAESCIYCLVRGKGIDRTEIKGPSIRLAEIAASCWGNIYAATRIVENDGRFVTAQGVAWDLQINNKMSADVKRKITTKEGRTYSEDMQVVTGNAACSIALRNAILKVVPRAYVNRVYDAAVKYAVGDQKSLPAKRKELFSKCAKLGIEEKMILSFFDKESIEGINGDEMRQIIGIVTAIKENVISIDKAFSKELSDNPTEDKLRSLIENK